MLEVLERDVARLPELLGAQLPPPPDVPQAPAPRAPAEPVETQSRQPVQLGLF
jgi:hypothetical protein